jgi:hypothetical protein
MMRIVPILIGGLIIIGVVFTLRNTTKPPTTTVPTPSITSGTQTTAPTDVVTKGTSQVTRPMMGQESFGLAVCEEVPQALVEKIVGKPIVEVKDHSNNDTIGCEYVMNKETLENVVVVVAYMDAENQKKFYESTGKHVKTDPAIGMPHFYVWDESKSQIGGIFLLMAPKKYVRVERSSLTAMTNEQSLALAKRVAEIIMTER